MFTLQAYLALATSKLPIANLNSGLPSGVVISTHSKRVQGLNPGCYLSVWRLHVLPVYA